MYWLRILCTRSIAAFVPESLKPAARIWAIWLVGSSRLAWCAFATDTSTGATTVLASMARSARSSAIRRSSAAVIAGLSAPPGLPESATICWGASDPGPSVRSSTNRPSVACVPAGTPRLSPPVTARCRAGNASASIAASAHTNTGTGWRMMPRASRVQKPVSLAVRRSMIRLGITRSALMRRPISDSSAGSNVAEAITLTTGTSSPPIPIERMNGSGMNASRASPTATVIPEKIVARPAVSIVLSSASCVSSVFSSSSRKRNTTSIE